MIPALDYVGKGFEERRIFLPQLLMSAEAAKAAFNVIRDKMAAEGGSQSNGIKVILATVKGDITTLAKILLKYCLKTTAIRLLTLARTCRLKKLQKLRCRIK